jgi:hypothetical protein
VPHNPLHDVEAVEGCRKVDWRGIFREFSPRGGDLERKAVAWLEWDYAGPSDDGLPFEWKPSDWGYLDDRVVAVDYAATVEL